MASDIEQEFYFLHCWHMIDMFILVHTCLVWVIRFPIHSFHDHQQQLWKGVKKKETEPEDVRMKADQKNQVQTRLACQVCYY